MASAGTGPEMASALSWSRAVCVRPGRDQMGMLANQGKQCPPTTLRKKSLLTA
jgi:hypothetical protein